MDNFQRIREHLSKLIGGDSEAHASFRKAVADLPVPLQGAKAPNAPHTAWQLLEHMRITQHDILQFTRDAHYQSPKWPEGYWPDFEAPSEKGAWEKSVQQFAADAAAFRQIVNDPATDLTAPLSHGDGQTVMREALLIADHTAYHVGQLILLRILLGAWK